MKIKVLLCALLAGTLAMADELLSETVKTYSWMSKSGYSVKMVSPEVGQLMSQLILAKSQQTMGIPLVVKIRNFELTSDILNGLSAKVGLDMPDEATRNQMEAQLNQMLTTMGFSKVMADSSIGAIAKLTEYLGKNASAFTQTAESNDVVAQYSCETPNMSLMGNMSVSKILVNVNKQYKIIPAIRFDFSDGSAILVQFSHDMVDGRACPQRMILRHTIKQIPGGMKLPQTVNAAFSDYKFK